jgi:hypothetical protein
VVLIKFTHISMKTAKAVIALPGYAVSLAHDDL